MSPEPDVLERGKVYFDEHFTEEGPIPRELCSDVEQLLADAMAEIKRLRGMEDRVGEIAAAYEEMHSKLRAITEAKPVGWQAKWIGASDHEPEGWFGVSDTGLDYFTNSESYITRALIVAPKGDTEE